MRSGADSAAAADAEAGTASDPNASAYQLSSGDVTAGTSVTDTNKLITNAYDAEYEAVYQAYVDKKNGNQKAYMYDAQTGKLTELKVGSSLTVNNPSDETYDGQPTKISVKAGTFIYGNGVTLYNDNNGWYLDTGFQDNSYSTMSTYADTYASATPTDNTPGDSGNTNTSTETPEVAINSAVGNETDGFDVVGTATPNAEVTVRETNTRVNQTATAGDDGSYTVHFAPADANVGDTVAAQSSIVDEAGNTLLSTEATATFTAENTAQDVKYTVTYSGAGDNTPATDTITVTWDQSTNGAGDTLWSPEAPDLTEGTTVTATATGYTISVNSPAVDGYTADPVTATFDLSAGAAAPTAKNVDVTYTATGTSTPTSGTSTPTSGTSTPTSGTSTPTSGTSTPTSGTSTPTSGTSTPTSGTSTPTSGTSTPTSGTSTPTSGTSTPTSGTSTPTSGTSTPTSGTSTPTSGTSTPTSGTSTPTSGTSTPTSGTSTPTSGTSTPTSGTSTPTSGESSAASSSASEAGSYATDAGKDASNASSSASDAGKSASEASSSANVASSAANADPNNSAVSSAASTASSASSVASSAASDASSAATTASSAASTASSAASAANSDAAAGNSSAAASDASVASSAENIASSAASTAASDASTASSAASVASSAANTAASTANSDAANNPSSAASSSAS
ncbi:hypothetical protein, partial [Loigolactobacillus backii]|uniref:hypothetical protein n=1 Tax=Loigolactobacillus backii TaxID=375175 RepID=UPI0017839BBC